MTDTNPRDLIRNMAEELDLYREIARENCWAGPTSTHPLADEARAYLAQAEPEGPTDDELQMLLYYEFTTSTGHGERSDPIGFARAVLAGWGSQPSTVAHSTPRWYDSTAPTQEP